MHPKGISFGAPAVKFFTRLDLDQIFLFLDRREREVGSIDDFSDHRNTTPILIRKKIMTDPSRELAIEGIRFFGEMSASVSHEIKNVLAIVNENAGLLKDLVAMGERGMPPSLERLKILAEAIERQILRGDRIVKNMNRFAHSADHPQEAVDVCEVIRFVIDLTSRLISMRGVEPILTLPSKPVMVDTNRFFLENLVWACLRRSLEANTEAPAVDIIVESDQTGVRVRFRQTTDQAMSVLDDFPSSRMLTVARMTNAHITIEPEANEIILSL